MAEKEEDGNDGMLGELREMAQMLQEMISQGVDSDHDDGQGGENKVNSDEMSNHQLAGLSTTYNVLAAYYKSDIANLETRNVPVSSSEAVPFSPEPSSSDLTNVEIKRMPISSAKEAPDPLLRPPHTRMISLSGLSLKPIKNDDSVHEKSLAIREQLGDSDLASKYNLPSDEEVTNPIDYTSSDYDVVRKQLQEHFSLLSIANDVDSKELTKIELDPGYSASSLNQPMTTRESITTTASSHGHRPSISMTKALTTATDFVPKKNQQVMNLPQTQGNQQVMNLPQTQGNQQAMNLPQTQGNQQVMNPHYPQWQVPSGQYDNITRPPYLSPSAPPFQQHGGSNMGPSYLPPSAPPFHQHGGSTSNLVPYGTMVTSSSWRPEQNDIYNYNMPQHVPPNYDVYMGPYAYGYDNHSDTSANSRFGYDGAPGNYMSSIRQHQSGDSPSSSSQQQRQQQPRSDDSATQTQQEDRSDDPSDQAQRDE
ncbi:unnamed protein product [Eruca vesicaria subsp. sativa]|uniref:Uncharacterized protein n=1 Tax=Eruca vesicaria subsp. sativa TaxID=29727 RepID=A0ABC8L6B1_ERUVS|nr:unnamed protein product [Eruca vesicaria subsp. sativa]